MIRKMIAAIVLALTLAACGSSGASGSPTGISAVVDQLRADGLPVQSVEAREPGIFAQQSVDVTFALDGDEITGVINTFGNLDGRDSWIDVAHSLGGYGIVRGNELWTVSPDSDRPDSLDIAQALAGMIDGELA